MDIIIGADPNEDLKSLGQSATQFPQEHIIETERARFHLIDTRALAIAEVSRKIRRISRTSWPS